jgi:hypothetical protein
MRALQKVEDKENMVRRKIAWHIRMVGTPLK